MFEVRVSQNPVRVFFSNPTILSSPWITAVTWGRIRKYLDSLPVYQLWWIFFLQRLYNLGTKFFIFFNFHSFGSSTQRRKWLYRKFMMNWLTDCSLTMMLSEHKMFIRRLLDIHNIQKTSKRHLVFLPSINTRCFRDVF